MGDILDKDIQDLRNQQFKRNLIVSSFAIVGGVAGFLITRANKSKTWVKIGSVLLGAVIVGLPVMLLTRKKYQERKKAIKDKSDLTIKVTEGKINIKPNVLTATNQAKIETIITNIEKANNENFTKQERPRIEDYFSKLSDEELTTWVKLSQSLTDKKIQTLPDNQKEKYLKDKYGLDIKNSANLLMKYMDFVVENPTIENVSTKQT
jgi:hypothetical protein